MALALVFVCCLAACSSGSTRVRAQLAGCRRPDPGRLGYEWPLRPFDAMHPVRGNFGDPRTLFMRSLSDHAAGSGTFSFHDGVDISAHVWSRVYAVASGRARILDPESVEVRTPDDRRFIYRHISLMVANGAQVTASKTVLGVIIKPWRHVHLTEIDPISVRGVADSGYRVVNPLAHLVPFGERTPPVVSTVVARDRLGRPQRLSDLHGAVRLIVDAFDLPGVPIAGVGRDRPVAPAVV